jgi:hypothetical protein
MTQQLRQLLDRRRARLALRRTRPLLRALAKADAAREQLRQAEAAIQACFEFLIPEQFRDSYDFDDREMLLSDAELCHLQNAWADFRLEGGVTEADFHNWLEGRSVTRLGEKAGCAKKHLRLVAAESSLPRVQLAPRINNSDPPEAA